MKTNRTIGKRQVMEAAKARGMLVMRVKTAEGRRWEVSNGKGLRAFFKTLWGVWMVVKPAPVKLPSEAVVDGDLPSPPPSPTPLQGREARGEGAEAEGTEQAVKEGV